jgi:hypothetical protein
MAGGRSLPGCRRLTDMNLPSGNGGGGGEPSGTTVEPPKNVFDFKTVVAGMLFGTRSAHLSCRGASSAIAGDVVAIAKATSAPFSPLFIPPSFP